MDEETPFFGILLECGRPGLLESQVKARVFDKVRVTSEKCQLIKDLVGIVGSKDNAVGERITTVRDKASLAVTKTVEERMEEIGFHVGLRKTL